MEGKGAWRGGFSKICKSYFWPTKAYLKGLLCCFNSSGLLVTQECSTLSTATLPPFSLYKMLCFWFMAGEDEVSNICKTALVATTRQNKKRSHRESHTSEYIESSKSIKRRLVQLERRDDDTNAPRNPLNASSTNQSGPAPHVIPEQQPPQQRNSAKNRNEENDHVEIRTKETVESLKKTVADLIARKNAGILKWRRQQEEQREFGVWEAAIVNTSHIIPFM